jgi:hypothetical protein
MFLLNYLSCTGAKLVKVIPEIDEVWVYNYFPSRGYTTASAYSEFNYLEENNIDKFKLSQNDVDTLYSIMSDAKVKKLFQTKTGQGVIFVEIITFDNQKLRTLICSPNLISINNQIDCWISNELQQKWLSDFKGRMSDNFFSCSPIHKCNSNDNMKQTVIERQVHNFAEIPTELLAHIDKMGVDSSFIINEYEGRYLNFIFGTDKNGFNLIEKKVGFNRSKMDFFQDERERFYRSSTPVGLAILYIFTAEQKTESGGYDAAIVYWSKFLVPIEKVVKRLKEKR